MELTEAVVALLPAVVKARTDADGRRLVEVEASSEAVDDEGDVILQRALLDSAASFVRTGHLDIDHVSELGARLGVPDPSSWIVGRPTEVVDLGGGRTAVRGELMRHRTHDPKVHKADELWDSMQGDPPVRWLASIYGFPKSGMTDDCRSAACDPPARRFLVRGIDWRSLAFTRNPVNTDLRGFARVVTAKSYLAAMAKYGAAGGATPVPAMAMGGDPPASMAWPKSLDEMVGQHSRHISRACPWASGVNSAAGFGDHFEKCCGMPKGEAEIYGHALMHHLNLDRKRRAMARDG